MADPLSPPTLTWVGDSCLRIAFGPESSPETHARVGAAFHALREKNFPNVTDLTPAYTTILVRFRPGTPFAENESLLRAALAASAGGAAQKPERTIEIPVCYEAPFAPDLSAVAEYCKLTTDEVVTIHSGATYEVAFIGFSPGFPYMSGIPKSLIVPRLERPRVRVPAGSIGIAGNQAGIYPRSTPGGWRLIGRTPLNLFDAHRESPSLLSMADRVRFVAMSTAEFEATNTHNERRN